MSAWLDGLRTLRPGEPMAMVSVLASEGSAPRGAGTRMLVGANAMRGTIGGGQLEYRAVAQARALLALPPGSWRVQDYPLGPLLGQCCGGRVRLLIEHVDGARLAWAGAADDDDVVVTRLLPGGIEREVERRSDGDAPLTRLSARGERPGAGAVFAESIGAWRRPVYLFGAGHVGQAIARHGAMLPLRVAWFDTRDEFGGIDGVTVVDEERIADCVAEASAGAAVLILTHDHALDYALTRAAVLRAQPGFTGLIGSATKRARFLARLARDGVSAAARARLTCPIGIAGITGKEPEVIAIAALAQLLQLAVASQSRVERQEALRCAC